MYLHLVLQTQPVSASRRVRTRRQQQKVVDHLDAAIIARQRADGSWTNTKANRWQEDDPLIGKNVSWHRSGGNTSLVWRSEELLYVMVSQLELRRLMSVARKLVG